MQYYVRVRKAGTNHSEWWFPALIVPSDTDPLDPIECAIWCTEMNEKQSENVYSIVPENRAVKLVHFGDIFHKR